MTNPNKDYKDRGIVTEQEMEEMLHQASLITNDYFRLRVRAVLGLEKIFGKRRIELCRLELSDLTVEKDFLLVVFTIAKKHKKGLFQYLQFLRKKGDPQLLNKPLPELEAEWHEWQLTLDGYRMKEVKRPKKVSTKDKYAKLILEYYESMKAKHPEAKFLFPSGKTVFGTYLIYGDRPLSGRQLLNIIKPLNRTVWLHLLRKTKGALTAREHGRTIEAVDAVKNTLDLSNPETAYHYIEEFVPKEEHGEEQVESSGL